VIGLYRRMEIEVHTRRHFGAHEEDVAGWHVVHVTGEVDAHTAGMLPTLVLYAVRRGAEQVCLDLTALERVDRSGAEALRRCTRAARYAGGRLAMIEPDDPGVAEVLADTGVVRDVPVVSRREQLVAGRARPRGDTPRAATRPRRPSRGR
jgi:anti-anti-sigma factor